MKDIFDSVVYQPLCRGEILENFPIISRFSGFRPNSIGAQLADTTFGSKPHIPLCIGR